MRNILLALFLFTASAMAADFTGKWSGEGVTNGEAHALYFVLKQMGDTVTGTSGPDASEQHDFTTIKVDGSKIVLDVTIGDNGSLHFELEGEGDSLKGTVRVKHGDTSESGTVTMKKIPG
jgi:hypothetical protein